MNKLLLVYNPVSGAANMASSLSVLIDYYTKNGWLVSVHPTQSRNDASSFLKEHAHEFERIIVAGGDGIIHEAVNGLAENDHPGILGIIPGGTANDFASSFRIDSDPLKAAESSLNQAVQIDTGLFNQERFSYVAAFGVGTSVSYKTAQTEKNRFGMMAYIIQAMKETDLVHWENNCATMKIEWEGGQAEGDFLFGSVSNSRYIAGSDLFTGGFFDAQDGLLEGCFIRRPMNLTELNSIIGSLTHHEAGNPLIIQVQSPWFEIKSDVQENWTLDGEFGGALDQVFIQVVPGSLSIALPEKGEDHGA